MAVSADTLALPATGARRREALVGLVLFLPSAVLVLAFTLFPVAYNVWLGFHAKHSLRPATTWVGLANYAQILADPDFWRSVWLATVYALGSTGLQIVAGVVGALILHRRFAGCDFLRGVALFPYMIPTVIAVFVWPRDSPVAVVLLFGVLRMEECILKVLSRDRSLHGAGKGVYGEDVRPAAGGLLQPEQDLLGRELHNSTSD